jgi:dolichol kinase
MVDPIAFDVGPVSINSARVLAAGIGVYAILTAKHTADAFRKKLEDKGSALLATWVMMGLAIMLWEDGARLIPAPYSLFVIGTYVVGITITLGYTLGNAEKKLQHWRSDMEHLVEEWVHKALPDAQREAWLEKRFTDLHPEQQRKTPHLMMGMFIAGYLFLGYWILAGLHALVPADALAGESLRNVRATLDAGWVASGHMVAISCMLGLLLMMLPVEIIRLRFPEMSYPFKGTITSMMRTRERGLFGAHYYIAATLPLAVLWLTEDTAAWGRTLYAVPALLGVTVFADAASALVGIRWGKRRWPHIPNKTLMGTLGGCVVAFIVALPFVGLAVAFASALVFFLVDVLAPVPISVSDNILNPLALAAAYIMLADYLQPLLPVY